MTNFDEEAKTWDENPLRVARANAVAAAMQSRLPLRPSMRAMEYGSGTGLLSFALRSSLGHITLADSSPGMLAVLAEKIAASGANHSMRPLRLDLAIHPAPEERFQLIYTLMALHHISDIDKILRDFCTLLDPGGWLCIADLDQEDGSYHGPDFAGHAGFDRATLAAKARQAGLGNISFSTVFYMPKVVAERKKDFPLFLMSAQKP